MYMHIPVYKNLSGWRLDMIKNVPSLCIACLFLILFTQSTSLATALPLMRISVENTDTHVQTKMVKLFATELRERLGDKLEVQLYANARLFRDKDIIQALSQGKTEMAVPGTWHVMNYEANIGVFLLPFFYGRDPQINYQVVDGSIGRAINKQIEDKLQIKVVGRWIDLGHAHLFSMSKKIGHHEDIQGLRVRVAGGVANEYRIKAMGGIPMTVPWPDLPVYMEQGRIDAILTSYETVHSANLDKKGIRYVFEDKEYFAQYIPLIRGSFWSKLSPESQEIIIETWNKHVKYARNQASIAQEEAKTALIKSGVEVVIPDESQVTTWRTTMSAVQDDFIKKLKIDPNILSDIIDECQCQ